VTRFCLPALVGLFCLVPLQAQTPEIQGRLSTIHYLQSLQTKQGGFLPSAAQTAAGQKPTLRASSAAVRALHYLGGKVPDAAACTKFVQSCYDRASGGFADMPGGKPDVFSTAVGMMAVAALDVPEKDYRDSTVGYLSKNAQGFEDIRIAVAGLESFKATAPKQDEWLELVIRKRHPDGTWGEGAGAGRETGSAIVAVLRMKGPVVQGDNVLKVIKGGQRPDGGFGKADAAGSDLETTYRVMRAFFMLKARPDNVEGVRSFVAKCRNSDHGYGVRPGEPSNVGATYYAAIISHWLGKE
jgi:prenyltransferase beta subunit